MTAQQVGSFALEVHVHADLATHVERGHARIGDLIYIGMHILDRHRPTFVDEHVVAVAIVDKPPLPAIACGRAASFFQRKLQERIPAVKIVPVEYPDGFGRPFRHREIIPNSVRIYQSLPVCQMNCTIRCTPFCNLLFK